MLTPARLIGVYWRKPITERRGRNRFYMSPLPQGLGMYFHVRITNYPDLECTSIFVDQTKSLIGDVLPCSNIKLRILTRDILPRSNIKLSILTGNVLPRSNIKLNILNEDLQYVRTSEYSETFRSGIFEAGVYFIF